MVLLPEEKARREVEEWLRRPVHPEMWNYLVERNYVSEYLQGERSLEQLVAECRMLAKWEGKRPRPSRIRVEVPPRKEDKRWSLLNRILAREANRVPCVTQFRTLHLPNWEGQVLPPNEVSHWITERVHEDIDPLGIPYIFHSRRLPAGQAIAPLPADVAWLYSPSMPYEDWLSPHLRREGSGLVHVLWDDCDKLCYVMAPAPGILDDLTKTANCVVRTFGCSRGGATTFVLTGIFPGVVRASYDLLVYWDAIYPRTRILITLDPSVSPSEVADIYRQARKRAGSQRQRPFSSKVLALLEFAYEKRQQHMRWEDVRRLWNDQHSQWCYDDANMMSRDYHRARKKLLVAPRLL